jgi:hypothetical protein
MKWNILHEERFKQIGVAFKDKVVGIRKLDETKRREEDLTHFTC